MVINLCPTCRRVNAADARRCHACGGDLYDTETQAAPLQTLAASRSASALWLDDLGEPPRTHRRMSEPETASPLITLRDIGLPPAPAPVVQPPAEELVVSDPIVQPPLTVEAPIRDTRDASLIPVVQPPAEELVVSDPVVQRPLTEEAPIRDTRDASLIPVVQPPAEELVVSDPVVQPPLIREAPSRNTLGAPLVADAAARSARKAANKAKVRRARLRSASAAGSGSAAVPDVLVLDADDSSRAQLSGLLRAFGFGVRSAVDAAEAASLAASWPFVAAFVDIALTTADGGDGIDLCKQIHEVSAHRDGGAPVLVLLVAQLRSVDRVRAKLAGCDETILKPVTRGSVARLLDARGVALPSDARRI
jgi:CheY-like chemotaxis protein